MVKASYFRQAVSPSAEEHPPSLKRSLSHMDMVEPVQPVFTIQGPSGSVNNISRLRNNNTNLINGFYKVNKYLTIHHEFVFCRSQKRQLGSSDIFIRCEVRVGTIF